MYLRFYMVDNKRVYTLKKTSPNEEETKSAHPARFSPEDAKSKYRVTIKQRFGLLPTQQAKQWSRRRLLISFVLFFAGWKAVGFTLNDMLLWTVDEQTGIGRFLSPKEGKERKIAAEKSLDQRFLPQPPPKRFALDD